MNISIIVAVADNNVIGKDNKLLWHIPDDLKRFKKITTGHTVIMGKNTYLSIGKPLPDRRNIVISDDRNDNFPGCIMAYSIAEALAECNPDEENFVIGGASVYQQFLKYANKFYLTRIYASFEGDAFFPEINYDEWEKIEQVDCPPVSDMNSNLSYSYFVYRKK